MNKPLKIVADNKIPFLEGVLEPYTKVICLPGKNITKQHVKNADALLIRTRTKCNAQLLEGTTVKFIATATIGYDHIDTGYCKSANITWTNAPGCNSGSVQQYMALVLIHLAKKHNFRLSGKTIGIVGMGNVGSKVAKAAKLLGMNILLNDPPRARTENENIFVDIERIKQEADIITLHVPLNNSGIDKTFHLVDKAFIDSLPEGKILINTSRGEVVDNPELKKALQSKKIAAAVLDVWENEPGIDAELAALTDISTPHIAGYSKDGKANGTAMSVQALSRFFGFGLTNWFPENVPLPDKIEFTIDCTGKTDEMIVSEAIEKTYDIVSDDSRLRYSLHTFEKQRGDYPVRREFSSFHIHLIHQPKAVTEKLLKLGFKLF